MRTNNKAFALFVTPVAVTMDSIAIHLQMELIDLQCNTDLKTTSSPARMIIALYVFGSTYPCEQLSTKVIFAKSKMHNKLTAAHMEGTLRLASAHLQLDIQGLVKQAEHQTMH